MPLAEFKDLCVPIEELPQSTRETFDDVQEAFFEWDKIGRIYQEITPQIHDQCWWLVLPDPYRFTFWQQWLKGVRR